MNTQPQPRDDTPQPLTAYKAILLAVDSSDHSNRATREAVDLACRFGSRLTSAHVYAAKLHDLRFRQMEGGLPDQFREEQELERQRDVHDSLITKGLSIITDSYLDQVDRQAAASQLTIQRRSLEGKNYRELARETNCGRYDLLVMGALGLGAVKGSRLGTVCQRVSRRSRIDTLIVKQPERTLGDGPIVVGIDGSPKSYGGLLTALSLAGTWHVPVKVISAFDPYYHYVAFNRIAGVLSEEAGKVFRFQEQEKLHEEIIDSGLAKIYQGHLAVAQEIARDYGMEVETVLLDGKPHEVMLRYLQETNPSLLILGTTGIHADDELDIGGNTEYLLNDAPCAVLLSQQTYTPRIDRLAEVTTSWTHEAEQRMERVPSFVRPMARMAILRYAQEQGHTVITESIVEEATAQLMPNHAEQAMEEIVEAYDSGKLKQKPTAEQAMRWSDEATRLLLTVKDLSLRGNLSMRAEKRARGEGTRQVEATHIRHFLENQPEQQPVSGNEAVAAPGHPCPRGISESVHAAAPDHSPAGDMTWQTAALARLMRVPAGFMRDSSKQRIEAYARQQGTGEITLAVAEAGLAEARSAMMEMNVAEGRPRGEKPQGDKPSACPFAGAGANTQPGRDAAPAAAAKPDVLEWTAEARAMLGGVPVGFCRDMSVNAAESIARHNGVRIIDAAFISLVLETIKNGSESAGTSMTWSAEAEQRLSRVPDFVRGMLVREIEDWAGRQGKTTIDREAVEVVRAQWQERGAFHLDPADPRNSG
ncbi:universal stress protein [Sedimenticola hydrogenitrophicus]|uniref:universal stress protein n=1 Tax=Sedimenticola hydrogenitrophicus TaxID=2967975 RepID=UPI0023AE70DB|nr:universal stress protein [Sedimenticola hydrogenitrophicus]